VPTAAVPEATIDEDGNLFAAKDEIGFARERLTATPASNTAFTEERGKPQFCRSVAS